MSNFAKILRYQHTSLFDNDSDKLLLLSILIPGLVKKTRLTWENNWQFRNYLIFYVFFCFAALFAYPKVCLFKYVFLKNDIYVPQQR